MLTKNKKNQITAFLHIEQVSYFHFNKNKSLWWIPNTAQINRECNLDEIDFRHLEVSHPLGFVSGRIRE